MAVPTEIRCTACGRVATAADRYCGFCGARLDVDGATPAPDTGAHRPHADRILTALRAATIGEYDIAGELGRGGMAVVYLAHDLSLNRKVAIKALLPELLYTEGMDRRFKHEARIAAKLDHPNILVIHGVREATDLLYIVMKLVEGQPLSAIIRGASPLPLPVVRYIVRCVADALAYAHGEGVIHRDVKPANIMVDRRGNVVVMDFGIAKAADDAQLTRTGLVIGTPAYMSPEQCLAHGVTPASDQYSLGVVAYELLTGATPFRGSALEMQWSHATASPPPVRSLRPDCPTELEALVLRMLAKAPADRWPSLQDVSQALGDDTSTVNAARAALIALVSEAPAKRDRLPTTPASPLPIGPGPGAAADATTDPVKGDRVTPAEPVGRTEPTLTLSQQRIELTPGDAVELVVDVEAGDAGAADTSIRWESSNPAVASVSPNGFVTAIGPGLAEISCTWRGKRAVCAVHVAAAAAAVKVEPAPSVGRAAPPAYVAPLADVAQPAAAPPVRARAPAERARPRMQWWMGTLAAGAIAVAVYLGTQPGARPSTASGSATPTAASGSEPPTQRLGVASAPAPTTDSVSPASDAAPPANTARDPVTSQPSATPDVERPRSTAAPPATGNPPSSRPGTVPNASSGTTAAPKAATSAGEPVTPPPVPLARPDTSRLTTYRAETSGSGAARPSPAPTASADPPPTTPHDSAPERIPAPTRDIATALFTEFASAITSRTYSRLVAAYSQPTEPDAVSLWQNFLIFVRDYTPRATVRSVTVDSTSNPPRITANLEFRWTGDAGYDRTRAGTFTGVGLPVPNGWQLHRAQLTRRFW